MNQRDAKWMMLCGAMMVSFGMMLIINDHKQKKKESTTKAEYKCETDSCGVFVSHTWFDRFIQDTNSGGSDKDQSTIHTGFYNGKAEVCLIPFYMLPEAKK